MAIHPSGSSLARRGHGPRVVGLLLVAGYVAVLVTPVVLAALTAETGHSLVWELGRSFALVGVTILVMQVVLAARVRFIESQCGLDILSRFHGALGVFAVTLLVLHPVMFIADGAGLGLLLSAEAPWYIWMGKAALLLVLAQGITSVFRRKLRLGFQGWRRFHNLAAVAAVLGLTHSWFAGGDLRGTPMRVVWIALAAVAVSSYVYHRLCRPLRTRRRAYSVTDVKHENGNVWTLRFEPADGKQGLPFLPGQFHFIRLYRGDTFDGEEHPFTISSSPTASSSLTSTIKASGDFTKTICHTEPGTEVRSDGPYGRFSYVLAPSDADLVFIAGGIGITPLMSMLWHMHDTSANVNALLLYGNRSEQDIVFRDDLESLARAAHPNLKVVHVLSEPAGRWDGETGYVDEDKIRRHCGELTSKAFYVCGPPPMMRMVTRTLRQLGVPAHRIHSERFSL